MKIRQIISEAKVTTKVPTSKPRNFVAKNAIQSGAGVHKDKKKAAKQGDVKHKNKEIAEGAQTISEIKKGQKDSNGFTKCWPGKHAEGTKKGKNGKPVRNCVPNENVDEGAEFGSYYNEKLAQKVFDENPNLSTSGRAEELLDAGFKIAVLDLGKKQAQGIFGYDEDFPSDFVSSYSYLQKQGQTEGFDSTIDSVKTAVGKAANKVGDTLANALPKEMRPMDNQTAANFSANIATKPKLTTKESVNEARNPDLMSQSEYDDMEQNAMDYIKRDFKRREMEHELGHEDRGMYFVVIAKNGKWEYTKAQPRQEGMNAAQRVINSLHAKYPSMHLGMMGPDGKVYNHGKGR